MRINQTGWMIQETTDEQRAAMQTALDSGEIEPGSEEQALLTLLMTSRITLEDARYLRWHDVVLFADGVGVDPQWPDCPWGFLATERGHVEIKKDAARELTRIAPNAAEKKKDPTHPDWRVFTEYKSVPLHAADVLHNLNRIALMVGLPYGIWADASGERRAVDRPESDPLNIILQELKKPTTPVGDKIIQEAIAAAKALRSKHE